jgi:hypothetical protein
MRRATLAFSLRSEVDQKIIVALPRPVAGVIEQSPRTDLRIVRPGARSVELALKAGRSAAATLLLR